ncbi:hypothetical protein L226DRAFT_518199 [Lentinus tigrinus ALCF2SS1-7]|uniref:uncharacterized protein n=1 Tax=Lentinus tigrinus ALCF2SS1-7 TaxID=1328758 RepID=UPI001165E9EE|nr:hypothetical protein L226DRAFT_518199 [Lentinus tigrinus ALCF2SS1-7]
MPGTTQYEVLLDFTNDTHDCATVQLQRDYGRNTGAIVLLHPGESVTLVLDAARPYTRDTQSRAAADSGCRHSVQVCVKNTVKSGKRNPSLLRRLALRAHRARAWRDVSCTVSQLFPAAATHPALSPTSSDPLRPVQGITVDRHWRDMRFCMWNDA